jgi:Bacterial PH domain
MRFAPTTFRPAFGRVLSIMVAAIAVAGLAGFVVTGDWGGLLRYGWGLALLGVLAVALFWLPSLAVAEHEITVRNVFSTVHVPWPAIQRIDTKYALTLYTPRGKVTAWASPAPNRYASQVSASTDSRLAARGQGGSIRPGDLLNTASGAAAFVIRNHWEQLRDDGHLENPVIEEGAYRRDIHWVTIIVLAVLAAATLLGFAL